MTKSLRERFPEEFAALGQLFGEAPIEASLPRLDEIHEYTEEKWRDYAAQLPQGRVNYLLIAEAPPWSGAGAPPQYVLDPSSRSRTLMRALRKTFLPSSASRQLNAQDALAAFAQRGFLILDSTPFAMDYSGKRATSKYDKLVGLSALSYLQEKLRSHGLSWSGDVRIAFSVKLNARAVIKGLGGELELGGSKFALGPHLVAVNGAGYPDAGKLSALYARHHVGAV